MFRIKSRALTNYKGDIGDLLYYASSGTGLWSTYNQYADVPDYWLGRYYSAQAKRNSNVVFPYSDQGSEVIEWASMGRDKYNPCTHRKVNRVNLPFGMYYERATAPGTVYLEDYQRKPQPSYAQFALANMQHPSTDVQGVRARAWHSMQPRFEGEVSMLNFLFELKDFRDIAKFIFKKDMLGKIANLRDMFNRRLLATKTVEVHKGYHLYKPHLPDGEVAADWLTYQYAIKPLIADLGKILLQLALIADHAQSAFLQAGDTYQSSHFSEEINRSESMTYYTNNSYPWKYGVQNFTKFTATLRYKYDYRMRDPFQAWVKYWGMNPSFLVFWNALPFSFLADYVVQIGNSIRAMEHDPNVRIHDWTYGESYKTQFAAGHVTSGDSRVRHLIVNDKYLVSGAKKDVCIAGTTGSIYTRSVRTPYYGPAFPRWKMPSGTQFLNMAALARCFL